MRNLSYIDKIILLGLGILCYIIFFRHLGEFTLRIWDESRNAVNALEMLNNKNIFVTYFNNQPDLWNTKPPFHIWLVVTFFKIFGVNEVALRLPSAISATLVVFLIYFFSLKVLNNRWIGLLGSLIILSSMGFPDIHIGRTGDYDALLTLFVSFAALLSFVYLQNWEKKYLYLAGMFWILAVLTKSTAGLLMIPGVIIFVLIDKKVFKLIKKVEFWKTLLTGIVIIGAYYLTREFLNHGYLQAVLKEDLFGRFKNNIGHQSQGFWYYWNMMASFRFQKWIYFVPISILAYFFTKEKTIKKFLLYAYLLVITYFIIISKSETKQLWYDAQLYPFASLLVASFLVIGIKRLPLFLRFFPLLILCFYMQRYIRTNIAYIHRPDLDKSESCLKYGYLFRNKSIDKNGFIGVHRDLWCNPAQFYFENNGLPRKSLEEIVVNDKILTCDPITFDEIKKKHHTDTVFDDNRGCWGFKVTD